MKDPDLTPLLDPKATALMVIDVQERFRPVIPEFAPMVAGCVRLVRTFRILGLPIFVTEQYPRGLGSTVGEIREALGEGKIPEKTVFSSFGCAGIPEALQAAGIRSVLIAGIETHVCVRHPIPKGSAAAIEEQVRRRHGKSNRSR